MPSKAHGPGHAVSDLRGPRQAPNRERLWIFTGVTEPWGPLADSAHSAIKEPRAPSGAPSAPTVGAPVPRKHLPEQAEKARVCRARRPLLGRRVQQAGEHLKAEPGSAFAGSMCPQVCSCAFLFVVCCNSCSFLKIIKPEWRIYFSKISLVFPSKSLS